MAVAAPTTPERACSTPGAGGGVLQELRVTVENKPGVVAEIALALGREGVNIEDMALQPAADMRTGAISLWVAGESDAARAVEVMRELGPLGQRRRVQRVSAARFAESGPLEGSLTPPPDKSISHRAAFSRRWQTARSHVSGYLDSADTRSTLAAVEGLGARVEKADGPHGSLDLEVEGIGLAARRRTPGPEPSRSTSATRGR